MLAAKLLKVLLEESAHLDDTVSHALDFTEPLLVQLGIVHDGGCNAGTVDGRVGVERTDEDLELRVHALLLLGGFADEREGTDTLTVETLRILVAYVYGVIMNSTYHVLSKALAQSNVVTLLNKVSRSKSITAGITTGKALVSHIEESEVALLLHDVANLAPLVLGGVNTGRVVGASVQEDNAVVRSSLDVGKETLKVKADSVLVVVAVLLDLEAAVLEDGIVVGPAGGREVDLLSVRVETLQESTANSQRTGTRNGLGDDKTVLLEDGRIGSVGQLRSTLGEGRDTSDTGVFLVGLRGDNLFFCSANGRKDVRLALVVTCLSQERRKNQQPSPIS